MLRSRWHPLWLSRDALHRMSAVPPESDVVYGVRVSVVENDERSAVEAYGIVEEIFSPESGCFVRDR